MNRFRFVLVLFVLSFMHLYAQDANDAVVGW